MRVFISSTVYDLLDVRAEVADLLRSLGIAPVLNEDTLSAFDVKLDRNSIATCLANVEACDEFIIILDQRYGGSLKDAGFDDFSATHLEYRHAVKHKKPIHFYVRDRLEGDYATWKRNKRNNGDGDEKVNLPWVKDRALLTLLAEHRDLDAKADTSNWFDLFTNSTDLKESIAKRLRNRVTPEQVTAAIARNQFPLFDVATELKFIQERGVGVHVNLIGQLKNVGGSPAFDFSVAWEDEEADSEQTIVAAQQSQTVGFGAVLDAQANTKKRRMTVTYTSAVGVNVTDVFEFVMEANYGRQFGVVGGGYLIDRKFSRTTTPMVEVIEPEE